MYLKSKVPNPKQEMPTPTAWHSLAAPASFTLSKARKLSQVSINALASSW